MLTFQDGITVTTKDGRDIGKSQNAAFGAVTQVSAGKPQNTLETTQGQIDGFLSQLPFKYYLPEEASWEIDLGFTPGLPPGWIRCGRARL